MPTPTPAVSVIIPAYGVTAYIAETLDSVFRQTFGDFEAVVVNDGCPDTEALEQALAPYRERIVYVTKSNGGLASARNAGIAVARAPLIAFLDGDDMWREDYLAIQVGALERDPTADAVYLNTLLFGDSGFAGELTMDRTPSNGPVTFESLVNLKCQVAVSLLARKAAILRAGGFDEKLRRVEDYDLWLRMAKGGSRIIYHREPVFLYRVRGNSLSANSVKMLETLAVVLHKCKDTLPLTPAETAAVDAALVRAEIESYYLVGREALNKRDREGALAAFRELQRKHWSWKNFVRLVLLRLAPGLAFRLAGSQPLR
jgi:glycosyltransferase involved in cell wall biosynthesis